MTERLWTMTQMPRLIEMQKNYQIPGEVVEGIQTVLGIMDTYYGKDRNVDEDDGGYVFLIFCDSTDGWREAYMELLKKYHLKKEDAELQDIICESLETRWHSDLFLVSNDYGITIIYSVKKGGGLQ